MRYLENEIYDRIIEGDKVFDFLQEVVLDGIWYLDLESYNDQYFSLVFFKILGYKNNDFFENGKHWKSLIHPDDIKKTEELMDVHFVYPEIPFGQIIRYQHINGSSVWIQCKGIAIRNENGKPTRMFGVHVALNVSSLSEINDSKSLTKSKENNQISSKNQELFGELIDKNTQKEGIKAFFKDVSKRIKLTNQLNSKNVLLAHLVDKTTDSVLIFNGQLQLIYTKKQIEQFIGKKIEKLSMDLSESLNIFHPNHQADVFEIHEKARLNKERTITAQHLANHVDGKQIWLEDLVSFEYDELGNYKRAYIFSRDITERKLIEQSLEEESFKYKQIAELLNEEKKKNKKELYSELHYGINQLLFAAKLNIENSDLKDEHLEQSVSKLKIAIEHIGKIALELTTQFVFGNYFVSSLTDFILGLNNSIIKFIVETDKQEPYIIKDSSKKTIFRIVQQLVQFSIETTKASRTVFRLKQIESEFVNVSIDNGAIKCKTPLESLNLKSIQDRIYLLDGKKRFF